MCAPVGCHLCETRSLKPGSENAVPGGPPQGACPQLFGKAGFGSQCTFAWNSALNENITCTYINLSLNALLNEEVAMLELNRSKNRELVLEPQVEAASMLLDEDEED